MKNHSQGKVLVVDDMITNIALLKKNLESDYDIFEAYDGESAIEQVAIDMPDLILLDVQMPGIDGYEVCRRLKADKATQNIPIVFITSKDEEADETKGLELGAIDYITKPFKLPIVKARVKNFLQMKKMQDTLENLSSIDGLTGIPNRRYFDQVLHQEWQRAIRAEKSVSVIMMDIDFFKKYNDHYGHPTGDECLKSVATALSEPLHRPQDIVARYGGEEFVAVLPDTGIAGAFSIGESMRQNVKNLHIPHEQSLAAEFVTISVGIANIVPTNDYVPGNFILPIVNPDGQISIGGRCVEQQIRNHEQCAFIL